MIRHLEITFNDSLTVEYYEGRILDSMGYELAHVTGPTLGGVFDHLVRMDQESERDK